MSKKIILLLCVLIILTNIDALSYKNLTNGDVGIPSLDSGYKAELNPLPIFFTNPGLEINPYFLIYKNYDNPHYSDLPSEGDQIVVWFRLIPKIIDLKERIVIVAYTINPEGNPGEASSFLSPINFNVSIKKGQKGEGNSGVSIDSTISGIWQIKYMALNQTELIKFEKLSLDEKVNYKGFQTYKIHVFTYNEKLNIILTKSTIFLSIIGILVAIVTLFYTWKLGKEQIQKMEEHYERQTLKEDKREEEKQINLLETLQTELTFLKINLEAYIETFKKEGHYPIYELLDIDKSYLRDLKNKIRNIETIGLKKDLIKLKDKLSIINNLKSIAGKLEEERGNETKVKIMISAQRTGIINLIKDEVLPLLKKTKNFIKKEFKINL